MAATGFSQDQELEADQLGIRYVIRAGYNPRAALELLSDFERFDVASPFLRTHPYVTTRHEYLQRYLIESGALAPGDSTTPRATTPTAPAVSSAADSDRRQRLLEAQTLYPKGSTSWKNLQRQIDELNRR